MSFFVKKREKFTLSDSKKGFTLMELLIVIIILAILISLSIPTYQKTIERAKDKEAIANLLLIQAAEKIYKLETNKFYPESGSVTVIGTINDELRLDLKENIWDYSVEALGSGSNFLAIADRTAWKRREYWIRQGDEVPKCTGAGCILSSPKPAPSGGNEE